MPDRICEILSSSTEKYDQGRKRPIYGLYGAGYLWHLDPHAGVPDVLARLESCRPPTHSFVDAETFSAAPFADQTFALGLSWPFDTPP